MGVMANSEIGVPEQAIGALMVDGTYLDVLSFSPSKPLVEIHILIQISGGTAIDPNQEESRVDMNSPVFYSLPCVLSCAYHWLTSVALCIQAAVISWQSVYRCSR